MKRRHSIAPFRVVALAAATLFITACASNSELEQLRDTHQQAETRIQSLESQVEAAMSAAQAAQRTADEALAAASEAQACCEANLERMDRLFERAMQKD